MLRSQQFDSSSICAPEGKYLGRYDGAAVGMEHLLIQPSGSDQVGKGAENAPETIPALFC